MTTPRQTKAKVPVDISEIEPILNALTHGDPALAIGLIGSRAKGRPKEFSDWDFGVYFNQESHDRDLRHLKWDLQEQIFPYTFDVVNFNNVSPSRLPHMVSQSLLLKGQWPEALEKYHYE